MRHFRNYASRIPLFIRVVSLYVAVGLPCAAVINLTKPAEQPVLAITHTTLAVKATGDKATVTGTPKSIRLPQVGINLPVIDGTYDARSNTWSLTDDKAQFATITDKPNDYRGNTFIYGHDTSPVFASTSKLEKGDIAQVVTTNGHVFEYVYTGELTVDPTSTDVLEFNPTTPRLTLMTCSGLWSEHRRLMYFDFKGVA